MKYKFIINPNEIPTYDSLMIPLLYSLLELGGSGSIDEIDEKVFKITGLSEEVINIPHGDSGGRGEVSYRLAWTRTYLKHYKLIENSSRGIWSTKCNLEDIENLDSQKIVNIVKEQNKLKRLKSKNKEGIIDNKIESEELKLSIEEELTWKENLLSLLLELPSDSFERLTQRLLRESGFIQVEVTGKTGDGGIDGKGIIKINGLMSFHVMFQCKRYKGSVSPSHIRDFRGALQGRADKGLFVTTGTFTRDAIKEAIRDGAPPIDLIDGEELCLKLKELNLGIKTELIESVSISNSFFESI
jgi:restriction system protein